MTLAIFRGSLITGNLAGAAPVGDVGEGGDHLAVGFGADIKLGDSRAVSSQFPLAALSPKALGNERKA